MPELQLRQTSPYQAFGLSCPYGGTFYICADSSTQFIGCCAVDACASSSSSSTSDSIHQPNKRHINANEKEEGESSAIQKETRKDGGGKCPSENLRLSPPTGGSTTSSSNMDHVSSRRVEATGSVTEVAYTTTPSGPPTQSEVSAKSGGERLSNGAIGGIAAGVVVVLVLVVVVLLCRRRWAAKRKGQTCSGSSTLPPRDPGAGYDTVRNEGQDSHLSGTTAPVTSPYGDKPSPFQQIPSPSHSSVPVQEGSVWRYSGSSSQTSPMLDGSQSPPHQYHGFQHSQHSQRTSYLAPVSELSGEPMPQELANTAVMGVTGV
ncbi:hypothetical protein V8F06_007318 [Rhypophila decipiens]